MKGSFKHLVPLFLILFFWCFFICRAYFFTDLIINNTAVLHLGFFLMAVTAGYLFIFFLRSPQANRVINIKKTYCSNHLFYLFILIIFISLVFLGLRTGAFSNSFQEYFRIMRGTNSSILRSDPINMMYGGSVFLALYYNLALYSLLLLCQMIACVRVLTRSSFKELLFVVPLSLLYFYVYQAGYPLSTLFFGVFFSFFLGFMKKRFFCKYLLILIIITIAVFVYLDIRTKGGGISDNLDKYFFHYNTLGIARYSVQIEDESSLLHDVSYGKSLIGGLGHFIGRVFSKVGLSGPENQTVYSTSSEENREYIFIGKNSDGKPLYSNAFSTIIFEAYKDFKLPGILVYGFFMGFILSCLYYNAKKSEKALMFFLFLFIFVLNGLGMSLFGRSFTWFFVIIGCLIKSKYQNPELNSDLVYGHK